MQSADQEPFFHPSNLTEVARPIWNALRHSDEPEDFSDTFPTVLDSCTLRDRATMAAMILRDKGLAPMHAEPVLHVWKAAILEARTREYDTRQIEQAFMQEVMCGKNGEMLVALMSGTRRTVRPSSSGHTTHHGQATASTSPAGVA